jgi:uncharacterized protein (UPF0333 family)
MCRSQKGQAVLELAILGALIITAFSILIGYSEKYNREQSYMQQTFRASLKKAKAINNSAAWATVDFRRMPNVTNPVEIGTVGAFSGGNTVLWSDGKKEGGAETEPKSYFQLNRQEEYTQEIPVTEPQYNGTEVSNFGYSTDLNASTDVNNIHTSKHLVATDTITGGSTVGGSNVGFSTTLGNEGKYSGFSSGGGLDRSEGVQ